MVTHKIKCPKCGCEHNYESNLTKPNSKQSSVYGYTWETPKIKCQCGYEISVQIRVNVEVY